MGKERWLLGLTLPRVRRRPFLMRVLQSFFATLAASVPLIGR
jgi:hypothetical protein